MSADSRLDSSSNRIHPDDLEGARLAEKPPVEGGNGTELAGHVQPQAAGELADPDVVDWDGPDDPANPKNWSSSKKWANVYVLAIITFFSPLISSMFAPGVPQVQEEFNSSDQTLATFVVSVFLLGYVAGPLVLVPLADIYGRVAVYHAGNVGFIIFNVACAVSTNMNMLIGVCIPPFNLFLDAADKMSSVSLSGWPHRLRTDDCWRRHRGRHHAARAARSCHHGVELTGSGWSHHWPGHRRLPHSSGRLALAFLAGRDRFWCCRHCRCRCSSRDQPCGPPEVENQEATETDGEAAPSLEAGHGPLPKPDLHPSYRPSREAALSVSYMRPSLL